MKTQMITAAIIAIALSACAKQPQKTAMVDCKEATSINRPCEDRFDTASKQQPQKSKEVIKEKTFVLANEKK